MRMQLYHTTFTDYKQKRKYQPISHLLKDHSWRVHFLWSVLVSIGTNAQLPVSIAAPRKQLSTVGEGQRGGLSAGH
jgi:hypothetical protein